MKVKLKTDAGQVEIHTANYDREFLPGQVYELKDEAEQRQVLGTGLFEIATEEIKEGKGRAVR